MQAKTLTYLLLVFAGAPLCRTRQLSEAGGVHFEVASIKQATTGEIGGVHTYPGGRVAFRGCTPAYLIQEAFDIEDFQIAGGPAWIQTGRYDLDAAVPETSQSRHSMPPYSKAPMNGEQRRMLQSLLVERFRLEYRRESREGPVYLLVKGKKPLKLSDPKDTKAYPWSGGLRGGGISGDGLAGINESMEDLARRLSRYLGRPVLDQTELSGSFDFRVEYFADGPADVISTIMTCIKELGLNLSPSKGPLATIVIERIEKPSAN